LTKLEWKAGTSLCLVTGLHQFISRNVQSLAICFQSRDAINDLANLTELVEAISPEIASLDLIIDPHASGINQLSAVGLGALFSPLLQHFTHIEDLHTDAWVFAFALRASASTFVFPKLARTRLDHDILWSDYRTFATQPPVFSTETHLPMLQHVGAGHLGWLAVSPTLAGSIESISIGDNPGLPSKYDCQLFMDTFEKIGETCSSLKSLRCRSLLLRQRDDAPTFCNTITPLLRCIWLEELDISLEHKFVRTVVDDDIIAIAHWLAIAQATIHRSQRFRPLAST
jgi:hypothetical protein